MVAPFKRLLQAAGQAAGKKDKGTVTAPTQQQPAGAKEDAIGGPITAQARRQPLQGISTNVAPPSQGGVERRKAAEGSQEVRLALASAVYEASYTSSCLAFPWDVALPELNALKAKAKAQAQTRAAAASAQEAAAAAERSK